MTTIVAPPGTLPHRVLTKDEMHKAVGRVIDKYKSDAEKLERFAHYDEARYLHRDIQMLEHFISVGFFEQLAKEIPMNTGY